MKAPGQGGYSKLLCIGMDLSQFLKELWTSRNVKRDIRFWEFDFQRWKLSSQGSMLIKEQFPIASQRYKRDNYYRNSKHLKKWHWSSLEDPCINKSNNKNKRDFTVY